MHPRNNVRVLFIGGASRSGSTLLDRLLGSIPGFLSTGELRRLLDRGIERNELCGCGDPLLQCGFWSEVIRNAYGGGDDFDVRRVRGARGKVERTLHVPELLISGIRTARFREHVDRHTSNLTRLYRAMQEVSHCRVIVDSSKNPLQGFGLLATSGIDLHVVHLVRDSRAVAYSHQRVRRKPEIHWAQGYMLQRPPLHTARKWIRQNIMMHLLATSKNCGYTRVRYEDLVADPRRTLSDILADSGESASKLDFLTDHTARLQVTHTVSGNPMRFQSGTIEIRPDSEWCTQMDPRQKRAVTALTLPLLAAYGYLTKERLPARLSNVRLPGALTDSEPYSASSGSTNGH